MQYIFIFRLLYNLEEKEGSNVQLSAIYSKYVDFCKSSAILPATVNTVSKLIVRLFQNNMYRSINREENSVRKVRYNNIQFRQPSCMKEYSLLNFPSYCHVKLENGNISVTLPTEYIIDGKVCQKQFAINQGRLSIKVNEDVIDINALGIGTEAIRNQITIDAIVIICQQLSLCQGQKLCDNHSFAKNCNTEIWSHIGDENNTNLRVRSSFCDRVVQFTASGTICQKCARNLKAVEDKIPQSREPPSKISKSNDKNKDKFYEILPEGAPDKLECLVRSQMKNSAVAEPRQRRWEQPVVSTSVSLQSVTSSIPGPSGKWSFSITFQAFTTVLQEYHKSATRFSG